MLRSKQLTLKLVDRNDKAQERQSSQFKTKV